MDHSPSERYSFLDSEPPRRVRDGSFTASVPLVRRVGAEQQRLVEAGYGLTESSIFARDEQAASAQGQHGAGATRRDGQHGRARATSTSSTATCASADESLGTLVAAFPSPPAQSPTSPAVSSPSSATSRRGSLRPSLPPPCPPPRAPLPPLPPLPPTVSVGLGINVSRPTRRDSLSPTTGVPRPLSSSTYPSPFLPSPSSPNFTKYTLASKGSSYGLQKPLPALPAPSGSPSSPRSRRLPPTPPRNDAARVVLVPHSSAPPPTPNVSSAYGAEAPLVESPVEMHTSLRPPPPSPSSPSHLAPSPRRRTRTRTASTTSGSSRSSLDLGNITADLSDLAESFGRAGPSAAGGREGELGARSERDVTGEKLEEEQDEEQEEDDEKAQRALVRRVRSTIELQRRKASVASSIGSRSGRGSVASEAACAHTTGGYKAYKLTRRSSFLPPSSPTTTRRRRTTSSTSSRSSSASDSEIEFDLSLDTPATSPALERDGFGWSASIKAVGGEGRRYGRRQSSATTIESTGEGGGGGGGGRGGKAELGWGPPHEQHDELDVLAPLTIRRSASSAPPPVSPSTRSYLAPPPTSALPRPTLSTARSTPSLRRPALAAPSPSLTVPPNSPAPPQRLSAGAPPTLPVPLPPVSEPSSSAERHHAPPHPHSHSHPTTMKTSSTSRLRPLVTASAARTGPSATAPASRLPVPTAATVVKPLLAGSALRLPVPVGAPRALRPPSMVASEAGAGAAQGVRAAPRAQGHGRRSSLQMLPYLVTE
ncbi:hypothetical protein JCM9279_006950 [Rhodotorula babjevae]